MRVRWRTEFLQCVDLGQGIDLLNGFEVIFHALDRGVLPCLQILGL